MKRLPPIVKSPVREELKQIEKQKQILEGEDFHPANIKRFAKLVLILEIIIIVMYGVFVRFKIPATATSFFNAEYYPAYQDVNVMMLIGFGFLMTFVKRHSWSALAYTFLINAIGVQLYILMNGFWDQTIKHGYTGHIEINQKVFTSASYCVAASLISFGGVLGRVGPLELLIMTVIQVIGYTLNEVVIYQSLNVFDVGGSIAIHIYGAYFGLTVSYALGRTVKPTSKATSNYMSNTFAMIGTLFLWMYWPSFNFGVFANTDYQKSQIILNTVISLTGSCLSTFFVCIMISKKLAMEDILNATLAGGVIIGSASGLIYYPVTALVIGFIGGIVSTLGFHYLSSKIQEKFKVFDTCGIHNLHGIPGVLGGLVSGIIIASYSQAGTIGSGVSGTYLTFFNNLKAGSLYSQAAMQIAGTFASMGIAILCAIIAVFFINCYYSFRPNQFFQDSVYFEDAEELSQLTSPLKAKQNNFIKVATNMERSSLDVL